MSSLQISDFYKQKLYKLGWIGGSFTSAPVHVEDKDTKYSFLWVKNGVSLNMYIVEEGNKTKGTPTVFALRGSRE